MKSCLIFVVLASTVYFVDTSELWAEELTGLRVSKNGRFLVRDDGSGFFPIADTVWGIAWESDRSEVASYLQRRKEQKFNTIAVVAFPSYEGIRTVPNAYGDTPFAIHHGRWNPLSPITTSGRNPEHSTEYDYWDHLEYVIDTAASNEVYVVLLPTWGSCVAGDWGDGDDKWESVEDNPKSEIIFNSTKAYQYGRWISQRFKDKKNIIWMIGGDRSAVYGKKDYRDVFRAMAEGVADGANGVDRQDGKADFSTTLMSYHPRKWKPNSSEWFHNDPWLDFNSIQDQLC